MLLPSLPIKMDINMASASACRGDSFGPHVQRLSVGVDFVVAPLRRGSWRFTIYTSKEEENINLLARLLNKTNWPTVRLIWS